MKKLLVCFALAASPVALAQGPAAADTAFAVKVEAPPAKKGQKAVAKIHVTPGAGFHINKEYPTSLALTPPAGVTLDKAKLNAKDAAAWTEKAGEFDVAYTASKPGKQTVTGELKFALCSANSCDPKKSAVSFDIDVK